MPERRAGRPEAAAAIWSWREAPQRPAGSPRRARLRGALQGAVGIVLGALFLALGHGVVGWIAAGIGTTVLLAALLSPTGLYAAIEGAFAALGERVGRGLAYLLMPAIFYGFFLPFSLLFRRGRRDAMRRFYEPEAASYWTKRREEQVASRPRTRQY